MRPLLLTVLMSGCLLAQELTMEAIRKEPDVVKRYTAALNFASAQIDAARKHISANDHAAFTADLQAFSEAVQFTDDTLRATGRNPSRSPKHFKKAEQRMNEFRRRLTSLENEVGVDDRQPVNDARKKLGELHDSLLQDIMGRRK